MLIKNGLVFTENFTFEKLDVAFADGVITGVGLPGTLPQEAETLDAAGSLVLPGYVDIHVHGAAGTDFSDGSEADIRNMAAYEATQGVTTFCGTTMTFSEEILAGIMDAANTVMNAPGEKESTLRGINMEGPFISMAKKGAQNGQYIMPPDIDMFRRLYARSGDRIRLVDIAPEEPGSIEFVREASKLCTVSLAHTTAGYAIAEAAYLAGASHATHLFNAMPAYQHRDPGVVGAAGDYAAHVEIISDGIHLHPSVVRNTFRMFGPGRVCLISDSMRAAGMPNGEYSLGGQKVIMTDGKATLEDGTIAGSAVCLAEMVRRAVRFGVPMENAIRAATANTAQAAGLWDTVGSLRVGKCADVLVMDRDLTPKAIFLRGVAL